MKHFKCLIKKWNKNILTIALCALLFGIIGFVVCFFYGEKVYMWYFMPLFENPNKQFDMSIFWSCVSAIGTIIVSVVAVWQTGKANQLTKQISENQLKSTDKPFLAITSIEASRSFIFEKSEHIGEISITNADDCNVGYEAQGVWNIDIKDGGAQKDGGIQELAISIDFTNIGVGIAKEIFAAKAGIPMISAEYEHTNCLGYFLQKDKTAKFIIIVKPFNTQKIHKISLRFTYKSIHEVPFSCFVDIFIVERQIVIIQREAPHND